MMVLILEPMEPHTGGRTLKHLKISLCDIFHVQEFEYHY